VGFFSSRDQRSKLTEKPKDRQENLSADDMLLKRLQAVFDDTAFDDRIDRLIDLGIPASTQKFLLSLRRQFNERNRLSEKQWEKLEEIEAYYH
jgi:hypothetical protein